MHVNWQAIRKKWPRYDVGNQDAAVVDVSQCMFYGEGNHEFAVYTFSRYLRQAKRQSATRYPICIQFGIHYPDYVSDDEPAIGHIRATLWNNTAGMSEPAILLAGIACRNGRAFCDLLWKELAKEPLLDASCPSARWIMSSVEDVLASVRRVSAADLPAFVEESPPETCAVVISIDDLPQEQFPGYEPSDSELSPLRYDNWIYSLKQKIMKGSDGRQPARERVVLREDIRRVSHSLYKGQLGWTVPVPGFVSKKGSSSLWIEVAFDSGVRLLVDVYWISFIREDCSRSVAEKILAAYRNSPFDADGTVASKWRRNLPVCFSSEARIVGTGFHEVYAYTFVSSMNEASLEGVEHYPTKIGYASSVVGALERINGQVPRALADDARVLFIGRCDDGRATESKIHRHLKKFGRRIVSAPGKEWFSTNVGEVETLFGKYR